MFDSPSLLVIDDEAPICEGCRRIFTRQGYRVFEAADGSTGFSLFEQHHPSAVLLDVKLPGRLDGLQLLRQIRVVNQTTPVVLMVGFPSIATAIDAVRWGASGIVTKPFTPQEVSEALREALTPRRPIPETQTAPVPLPAFDPGEELLFYRASWFLPGRGDEPGRAGFLLPLYRSKKIRQIRCPAIGDYVAQGTPLAELFDEEGGSTIVPAPLSGKIESIERECIDDPRRLSYPPGERAALVRLRPDSDHGELQRCRRRRAVLLCASQEGSRYYAKRLERFGCRIWPAGSWSELVKALLDSRAGVVVLDSTSWGAEGPGLVEQIRREFPNVRVVVVASPEEKLETRYRSLRIYYYAVRPIAEAEMIDILNSVFAFAMPEMPAKSTDTDRPIRAVRAVTHAGDDVKLLAGSGVLSQAGRLGYLICRKTAQRARSYEIVYGKAEIRPPLIVQAAKGRRRLVILQAGPAGFIPGSLRTTPLPNEGEEAPTSPGGVSVVPLTIEPPEAYDWSRLDPFTSDAIAEYVVRRLLLEF